MTSKELVYSTLEGTNKSGRAPRHLWVLPWATNNYPEQLEQMNKEFEWDMCYSPIPTYEKPLPAKGNAHEVGEFIDNWGCVFTNIHRGVIGEVKDPIVKGEEWEDVDNIHIPEEELLFDIEEVNELCKPLKDKFIVSACYPRPFEQLQFIRGTAELFMDLMDMPEKMTDFIAKMHDFYCRLVTKWAKTDIDAIKFQDDWGSQIDLLISPEIWRSVFKPMYQDYIDIAHAHGKKILMHSDGNTLRILPELIEMGLDGINTQIFCIGIEQLEQFKGKITFWGEIDRQNIIPYGTTKEVDEAVKLVHNTLWQDGYCIAQVEFGPGAKPENISQVFKSWDECTNK